MIAFLKFFPLISFSSLPLALILFGGSKPVPSIIVLLNKQFQEQEKASLAIKETPQLVRGWSGCGDIRLFLGDFEGAKSDYEKMIQLDPSLEVSHWRLGIAYFYLKEYEKAARQFEIYHNYDAVDRETEFGGLCPNSKARDWKPPVKEC